MSLERTNIRFKKEIKDLLEEAAYLSKLEGKKKTMAAIVNELIESPLNEYVARLRTLKS